MKNTVIALDTETFLIGPDAIAPRVVCLSMAGRGENGDFQVKLVSNGDGDSPFEEMHNYLEGLLSDDKYLIVGQAISYDLTCIVGSMPDLHPLIWKALENQRITDVRIRQQLLNLSNHGHIKNIPLPNGKSLPIKYDLATLVKDYLGYDRSKVKEDKDSWRLRFSELDLVKSKDFPKEAREYSIDDALDTLQVYESQEKEQSSPKGGPSSMRTHTFHTACDFALRMMTVRGIEIDSEEVQSALNKLNTGLNAENLPLLVKAGILIPPRKGEPYKRNPSKRKPDLPEKIDTKALKSHIEKVCINYKIPIKRTEKGSISADAAVLEDLAQYDFTLQEYQKRQKLNRLRTTELPKMLEGRVHPNYAVLKETGRTSSFGGDLYPSLNIQQVDPRIRPCYVPRKGFVFCSTDYSMIELASLGQKTFKLFGYSVHRDLINQGIDLHAYLGAQLAYNFSRTFSSKMESTNDPMKIYTEFLKYKETDFAFYKKFRTFAKPVDLGYPGGLGTDTFIGFAKAKYDISISIPEALEMKRIWLQTFPEMEYYFEWVKYQCKDSKNPGDFAYFTPLGMYRAGATFCACANGAGLQSPTAEGAKGALFQISKRCYDKTMKSILYRAAFPVMFIHDEIVTELRHDDILYERAVEISKVMNETMQEIMSDVKISSESALMHYWDKDAEPVYDENDRLIVWEPK